MKIKIDAIDTLFFKDGKPFSMGEETWADGIFPPPPSVIYGALRTTFFSENPNELSKANTNDDPTQNLVIKEISFTYGETEYVPIPLDYAKKKNEKVNIAYRLKPETMINLSSSSLNNNFLRLSPSENIEEIESVDEAIISFSSLKRYLKGEESKVSYIKLSDLVLSEPKIGIGRDDALHTTDEGKLYRVGLKRLYEKKENGNKINSLSLLVAFDGLDLPEKGLIKLGAEGKAAKYSLIQDEVQVFTDDELDKINDKSFIIYLLTPALFKNGWYPDFMNNELTKNLGLELVTASIGKPISLAGFDMVKKIPKLMRKAVPGGSVFFVKSNQVSFKEVYKSLNNKSISEYNRKEGLGLCFIGRYYD
ncbi:MAG: type III-B CRISPR module-associated protein Cmr3 [Stygiobacter sp.]